ncbi:hypothetical protein AB0J28_21805 [Streptosporangium canum]|uniref:hypothetical protein n=1 Tax=Streptosporangium canum TaxID=324952 RepID=UPI00343D3FEF
MAGSLPAAGAAGGNAAGSQEAGTAKAKPTLVLVPGAFAATSCHQSAHGTWWRSTAAYRRRPAIEARAIRN